MLRRRQAIAPAWGYALELLDRVVNPPGARESLRVGELDIDTTAAAQGRVQARAARCGKDSIQQGADAMIVGVMRMHVLVALPRYPLPNHVVAQVFVCKI